nr:hydroxymethylglutaryl-CoA synthase [Candidatus Sigynarchaeota archaeon]
GSAAEATQGAGAAALIICKDPRIAKIGGKFGKVSGHVNDFFRTLYSENAEVFGPYSTVAYYNFVLRAYDDFKRQTGPFLADYYIFHAPFGKMPIKSFQKIMFGRWIENPEKMKQMVEKHKTISVTPQERELILAGKEELQDSTIAMLRDKGFSNDEIIGLNYFYKEWLALKLMPCLDVPMRFGNCYSASLWAQLIHIIETRVKDNDTIYFTSYGSGAMAISGMFKMVPGFRECVSEGPTVLDYIKKKSRIPVEHYEMYKRDLVPGYIHAGHVAPAPGNKHFLDVTMCDKGCVLPQQTEVQYCPKGHKGVNSRHFPMLGIVEDIHQHGIELKDHTHTCLDAVYLLGNVKVGDMVELSVRRLRVDEDPDEEGYGLIHWLPVYVVEH